MIDRKLKDLQYEHQQEISKERKIVQILNENIEEERQKKYERNDSNA